MHSNLRISARELRLAAAVGGNVRGRNYHAARIKRSRGTNTMTAKAQLIRPCVCLCVWGGGEGVSNDDPVTAVLATEHLRRRCWVKGA